MKSLSILDVGEVNFGSFFFCLRLRKQITHTKVTRSQLLMAENSFNVLLEVFTHDKLLLIAFSCLLLSHSLLTHSTRNDDNLLPSNYFLFSFYSAIAFLSLLIVNITWDYYQMPQIFIEDFFLWAENKCLEINFESCKRNGTQKKWLGLSLFFFLK